MRVLIVTNMYPREEAPWYGIFVRQQVSDLRRAGLDVAVFVIEGWINWHEYLDAMPRLAETIAADPPDIIHAHHGYSAWVTRGALRKAATGTPWVVTLHDGDLFATTGVSTSHRMTRSLRLKAASKANAVIVVNEKHKPAARKLAHIPCGIDADRFRPTDREEARARLAHPPPDGSKLVFFPADPARPEKRIDRAREAIERVRLRGDDVTLVTGGDIAPDDMADYYNAADAVLLVSDYEASPTVIKEALACEAPIVSLRVGDAPALLEQVGGTVLCEPDVGEIAWGIHRAFREPRPTDGRARLRELGLTTPQVAQRLIALYEGVITEADE